MTHRFVKFGFAGIAASLSLGSLLTGCGGGGVDQDYLDSSSRALVGTYGKTSISALGTRVTCGEASSVLGDPKTELKDRNVVIDVCTPTDTITFSEDGRYAIKSYGGTEAGTFTSDGQRIELVRDTENGSGLSTAQIVVPMDISSIPLINTISPAIASVTCSRSSPLNLRH